VRLHLPAVPLKIPPIAEACTRAKPALEHADCPARPVVRRRFEEGPVPPVELSRDVEESSLRLPRLAVPYAIGRPLLLWHRAVDLMPRSSLHTLFLRNDARRSLLDAWSLQR